LFFRPIGAVVLAAAFSFAATTAALAAPDNGTGGTSKNWAGYAATPKSDQAFNFATASWVEPALPCPAVGMPSLATFSVGLDGYGNSFQEHVGTAIQCAGPPGHNMFKELGYYETCIGSACTTVRLTQAQFPVQAGDHITAAVWFSGGEFHFALDNDTQQASYTATAANNGGPRTSAEAIVDVPVPGGAAPLANFGEVTFTNFLSHASSADEDGNNDGDHQDGDHEGGHSKPVAITMTGPKSPVRAEPGAFHGNHFTVTWKASL
jgi:Peptidase A4 family